MTPLSLCFSVFIFWICPQNYNSIVPQYIRIYITFKEKQIKLPLDIGSESLGKSILVSKLISLSTSPLWDSGFSSVGFSSVGWKNNDYHTFEWKKESRMAAAKRPGRGRPGKTEQRKVWGLEWGPLVEQSAFLASPIYIGQARGRKKTYKKRSERARGLSLPQAQAHSLSLAPLHTFWVNMSSRLKDVFSFIF